MQVLGGEEMNDLENRVTQIETELSDIRDAVKSNTKNISKLYASVSALGAKFDALMTQISKQTETINLVFGQYKGIIDKMINSQSKGEKMHTELIEKVLRDLAYISVIAISAGFGAKALFGL